MTEETFSSEVLNNKSQGNLLPKLADGLHKPGICSLWRSLDGTLRLVRHSLLGDGGSQVRHFLTFHSQPEAKEGQTEPMRRPLIGIVFCYLAGTLAGVWIDDLHFITILALALLVLGSALALHYLDRPPTMKPQERKTAFAFHFLPGSANCLVYLAVFLGGWLAVNLCLNSPSGRDISALMDRPREGVEIIGVVADDPAFYRSWRNDRRFWSFRMRVEAINRLGFFQNARGEIQVTMPEDKKEGKIHPSYGERWRLSGALVDKAFDNSHRTDSVRNRIPCRFLFQIDRQSAEQVRLNGSSSWSILHWCFILRQKCADILARGIDHRPEVVGILHALLLGRQYELPSDLREAFVATGTYHIFAISGQHVAIIALFIVVVLQVYGVCRLYWFYYLAPVLILFTVMTGMSASALRGCIMALMCFLGPLFKRKTDISSVMALAALLIVGADPLQLFQAGFLLSFGIVAGLIVLCPPLIAMCERRLAPDPYRIEPEEWPAQSFRRGLRWLLFMMSASLAAWLVSTLLIARWFNLVSLVALPANLLVIPMATLVLLTGCLSIVSGFFCPFLAETFNFANVFFVSFMAGLTEVLARVPFGHIFLRSPPAWFICLWLGVLIVWRIYYRETKIWLSAVLVLVVAGVLTWQMNRKEWKIHVLNVDQCAVCFVDTAGGKNLLLNVGPKYQARNVLRYLRKIGVNRLRMFACPFPDAKHIGGAKDIIAALRPDRIWRNEQKPETGFRKELRPESERIQSGVGELTNVTWRARLDDSLQVLVNTGVQTQMVARILAGSGQTPLVVDIEETSISGLQNSDRRDGPAETLCRVLCCPAVEERMQNYDDQSSELQPPARIVLGPGQGILLLPGKEKGKLEAINLNLSGYGR